MTVGPWCVQYTPTGIRSIAFGDTSILIDSSFTVFQHDYKGHQFVMSDARVSQKDDGEAKVLEWTKGVSSRAQVAMALRLTGAELEWISKMSVLVDGPVEMAMLVPPEAVQSPTGAIHCRFGKSKTQIFENDFSTHVLAEPLVFDTPAHEWRFEPSASPGHWLFQDRREAQGGLRLIACLRADGKEPLDATVSLKLRVRSFGGAELKGRAKFLSQRARTLIQAPLKNAHFEDDPELSGWAHGKTASLAEETPPPGKRCAKLTVRNKEERSIYITQRVPCNPGSRYSARAMVRTEDVKEAEVLGMHSAGAVLILEWADADGKWLAPGGYAKGRFGTSNWHLQRVTDLIAPPDARYATTFLALRGTGVAWFDDVELYESRRSAVLLEPLDGTTFRDNRPRLTWQREPTAQSYTVQLSRDSTFPEAASISHMLDEPAFVPKQKLAAGTWHWRVKLDDDPAETVWSFNQTAPRDADTTGPFVQLRPQSFTAPTTPLRIAAEDESGVHSSSLRLFLDGRPTKYEVHEADDRLEITASAGWPRGGHEVTIRLGDVEGNTADASTWIVYGPRPQKTITWTRDRGVRVGDRREFPLGIYHVGEEDLQRAKDAGFGLVHIYTWESSQDDRACRRYLDAVHAAGLRAFVGFDRGGASGDGLVQGNFGMVARRIAALRDHPALYAWYLFDEPDLSHQYVSPKNMRRFYNFIKALDPDHPVIVTLAIGDSPKRYGKCYDVYWSMVYRDTQFVADKLAEHRTMIGEVPHMAIVHSYDPVQSKRLKRGEPIDESKFQPDEQLMRANAMMALVRGTSGLVWWWFGDHKRQWLATPDVPRMWEAHKRLIADLSRIEPVLVAPGRDVQVTLECTPKEANLQARSRQTDEGGVLIVVNPSKQNAKVRISSPGLREAKEIGGQGTVCAVRDGAFDDELAALAVKVYEIDYDQ